MPETINWPRNTRQPRRRKGLLFFASGLLFLLLISRTAISWWVDLLWFRSLGYSRTFWITRCFQWGTFAVFTLASFVIVYGVFLLFRKAYGNGLPAFHTLYVNGQPVHLPLAPVLGVGAVVIAVLLALVTGGALGAQWTTLALYWRAPQTTNGISDPIFGHTLSFYFFALPAWQLLSGWLLSLAIFITLTALLFLLVLGGARVFEPDPQSANSLPWRGLLLASSFLLLILSVREYLARFTLLFQHHTIFDGVTYTDAHITIHAMTWISAALALGAVIAAVSGVVNPRGRWLLASVVPAAFCYAVGGVAGWYVSTFVVKPNQLDLERPYISNNIRMTRQAYGLDRFDQQKFPAETDPAAADPANNQDTLQNIRLWDVNALEDTLRQVQEIRTYYDFPDIDIDRYVLDGKLREVMLGARELNVNKLPESSRNWINDKLIYTHGYGVTMNTVNGFTPEGLPELLLSNMPVQSTVPGLSVTRPEIYFGEETETDVYVKTDQREFNYPEGQSNNLSNYAGTGGIPLGGFLRRALIAFDRGDLTKVPFSHDITAQSRILMRRDVRARVAALAPFLTFDQDPYIVVGEDGHLYWMMDAFTSSDSYPYSTHSSMGDQTLNYMRNSVKAVVDAYDGTVTFYVFDREDPIINAWRSIFPGLFKDASAMPTWMHKHVRYPELLLSLQAEIYGLYHMTDPEVFYNREDQWTVATQTGSTDQGDQSAQPMEPNFVLMKLPHDSGLEFVEILPFTPINRNNLIGWIAARSDGNNYGTAVVYDFPKTRLVDGPQQIEARIDQNAQLSGQLTLWNQQGSHVRRGNLLVIPCGKALLYAEPIYLQAAQSPMPELRLVVLALQDRLAYGPTFESALTSLFGSAPSSLSESPATPATQEASSGPTTTQPITSTTALIQKANQDFNDYQSLTSQGRLGEAGQKLDELKRILGTLSSRTH